MLLALPPAAMVSPLSHRFLLAPLLAALCCSCTSPEERAHSAFAELCLLAGQVQHELATVVDRESADRASARLAELAEELRDVLSRLDALAEDSDLTPELRRSIGQQYHAPLREAVHGALKESERVVMRHMFWQSKALERLARREYAHYGAKGVHPWPRAVYAGREYRAKKEAK